MATDKLKLYNAALGHCGERRLATLNDNTEGRRLLDDAWDNGAVQYCLERGQWKFALRMAKLTYDPGITPDFGYRRVFAKPTDWVNTTGIWQDEYMTQPLLQYVDERGYWFASLDTIYARWVSNDGSYGMDFSKWPSSFTDYVGAYLASKIVLKLSNADDRREAILKRDTGILDVAKKEALNRDAMADPTKFAPTGSWVRSRYGWQGRRRDRGNPGSLIG